MGKHAGHHHRRAKATADGVSPRMALLSLIALSAAAVLGIWFWMHPTAPTARFSAAEFDDAPLLPAAAPNATEDEMAAEAMSVIDTLVSRFPESPAALSVRGHVLALFGRSAEALLCWRKSISLDPEFVQGYQQLAGELMEGGENSESVKLLRTAIGLAPTLPGLPNQLADALMHSGEMDEAQLVLEQALRQGTATEGTYFLLGQIALQQRAYQQARRHLLKAIEEDPNDTDAYYGLMQAAGRLGEAKEVDRWKQEFQTRKSADNERGRAQIRKREDRARVRSYLATAYREAGKVYSLQGDPEAAEAHWLQAAANSAGGTESLNALAQLYSRNQQLPKKAKALQLLCEIRPHDAEYHLELGQTLSAMGQTPAAESALRQFCSLAPDRADGYSALALLYIQTGSGGIDASSMAEKAVQVEPTAANFFLLGVARQSEGDLPGALSAVRRAVEMDPTNSAYQTAYQTLQHSR